MAHNPAHDLFSIGNFLCRVRVVDCCDLRNGAERQWFIVAMISGNFFFLKSFLVGTTTVMHRYGPNDTYPCVFNIKRTTYPYLLADFYDASQFEMKNFVNLTLSTLNATKVALASYVRHCCSRLLSFLVPLVFVRLRLYCDIRNLSRVYFKQY